MDDNRLFELFDEIKQGNISPEEAKEEVINSSKKKRGRPKKNTATTPEPKRKRGRPAGFEPYYMDLNIYTAWIRDRDSDLTQMQKREAIAKELCVSPAKVGKAITRLHISLSQGCRAFINEELKLVAFLGKEDYLETPYRNLFLLNDTHPLREIPLKINSEKNSKK